MSTYVAAIDLGSSKVAVAIGEKSSQGIRILAYAQVPNKGIKRGEIINITEVLKALNPAIAEANKQINTRPAQETLTIREVFVGISDAHIDCGAKSMKFTRSNADDVITAQEIRKMIKDVYKEGKDNRCILHVVPQAYNIGEHIGQSDILGCNGAEVEGSYKIFSGKSASADSIRTTVGRTDSRVKARTLILEPIAAASAVLTKEEKELGVALVDIGAGTTDIVLYHKGIVRHAVTIPIAGDAITADIASHCVIPSVDAENIKKLWGGCITEYAPKRIIKWKDGSCDLTHAKLYECIEARIKEILNTAIHEIEESGIKDKLRRGIVLTGGSSRLHFIQPLAARMSGMPTRISIPHSGVIATGSVDAIYDPAASVAVGLVVEGFRELENDENAVEMVEIRLAEYKDGDGDLFVTPKPSDPKESGNPNPGTKPDKEKNKGRSFIHRLGGLFTTDDNNQA